VSSDLTGARMMADTATRLYIFHTQKNYGIISSNGAEIGVLALYWFLLVGGAGSAAVRPSK
jgi:hypothetical protein